MVRSDSSVTTPEGLDGKKVGVVKASTAKTAFEEEYARLGISVTMNEYTSYPEMKAALVSGKVDAFVTDKSILFGYLGDDCVLLDAGFKTQQYGIACKLGNDKLGARVDSLLETLKNDGELTALFEKWELHNL